MTAHAITESMNQMHEVIKESARNSEKLVELKERLIKRNAVENEHFISMKLNGRNHRVHAVAA
jgi:hypothetical protein